MVFAEMRDSKLTSHTVLLSHMFDYRRHFSIVRDYIHQV